MDAEAHNVLTILNFGPVGTFPWLDFKEFPENILHKQILDRDFTFIIGNQNFKAIFKNAPIVGGPGEQEVTQKFLFIAGKTNHFPKGRCNEGKGCIAGTKARLETSKK